jgi:hypothetical protein
VEIADCAGNTKIMNATISSKLATISQVEEILFSQIDIFLIMLNSPLGVLRPGGLHLG